MNWANLNITFMSLKWLLFKQVIKSFALLNLLFPLFSSYLQLNETVQLSLDAEYRYSKTALHVNENCWNNLTIATFIYAVICKNRCDSARWMRRHGYTAVLMILSLDYFSIWRKFSHDVDNFLVTFDKSKRF